MTSQSGSRTLIEARLMADFDDPKLVPNIPARVEIRVAVGNSEFITIDAGVHGHPEREAPDGSDREHTYLMMNRLGEVLRNTVAAVRKDCSEWPE